MNVVLRPQQVSHRRSFQTACDIRCIIKKLSQVTSVIPFLFHSQYELEIHLVDSTSISLIIMDFTTLALLGLHLVSSASSNIIYQWTQSSSSPSARYWSEFPIGQQCEPAGDRSPSHRATKRDYSADGRCGPRNGNLLCDPNSTIYNGTCCSIHGYVVQQLHALLQVLDACFMP